MSSVRLRLAPPLLAPLERVERSAGDLLTMRSSLLELRAVQSGDLTGPGSVTLV